MPTSQVNPTGNGKAFYSLPELADRWMVNERTILREVERGNLAKKLIAGRIRFATPEIERYERTH